MSITKSEIVSILRSEYDRLWKDWYPTDANLKKATLKIEFSMSTTFYRPSEDCLYIFIADGNLEDFENQIQGHCHPMSKLGWYIHQTELVHEMLHEYQIKMVHQPTEEGKALFAKYGPTFDGRGHDELFFTVIVEKASYFGLTPDEFLKEL
ncbi:MAG: hypothetical protein ABSB78_04170 [Bacteroidota bacterium]